MKWCLWVLLTGAVVATAPAAKLDSPPAGTEPYYRFVPGEILVKFAADAPVLDAADLHRQCGGTPFYNSELLGFERVALSTGTSEEEALARYRQSPLVEWANYNYLAEAFFTPNDPLYSLQWHFPKINLPQAWDVTRGSSNVVVAVLDQAWQYNHEDWTGVQRVNPYDFIDNDANPEENLPLSHGMHVAGTIFAATHNNLGVAAVAPQCRLMPVRVLNNAGNGTAQQIADGIQWAAQHGADVINLSLGFPVDGPPSDPGPPISTAISNAANSGAIIIAASGNDSAQWVAYPAAYASVIAVGATNYNDVRTPYSNYGTALDVMAPGGNADEDLNHDGQPDGVASTVMIANQSQYVWFTGTSQAAPHVSGVAALLLSNGLAANQVRSALQETAVDLGTPGRDNVYGYGRINAAAALAWQSGGGGEQTLLEQNFDGSFPPAGWEVVRLGPNSMNWHQLAGDNQTGCGNAPHQGSNAVWHDDDRGSGGADVRDLLISAPINVPAGASDVRLSFYQRNCYLPDYYTDSTAHMVLLSTDNNRFYLLEEFDDRQESWAEASITIDTVAGRQIWIGFYYQGDYATEWYLDDIRVTVRMLDAEMPRVSTPNSIRLLEPNPNPFNSITRIPFEISSPVRAEISVYNLLGQRVTTLLPLSDVTAGQHQVLWKAEGSASGVYIVRLTTATEMKSQRVVLIR